MRKLFCFMVLSVLFLSGCSALTEAGTELSFGANKVEDAPDYVRSTSVIQMEEDANLYMTDYVQNGFFYFVMGVKEECADAESEPENEYQFFYQTYDSKDATPFCKVTDGYVRDFAGIAIDGKVELSVLRIGEEATILKYDEDGKNCREIVIDEMFNSLEEFPKLLAMADGGYAVGMADKVFLLNAEGQISETFKVDGLVKELYVRGENALFATAWKDEGKRSALCLTKLNLQNGKVEELRELSGDVLECFSFEDGFVFVLGDRVVFSHADKEDEEVLIDLDRQGFLASQIRFVFGNREEIKLVSMDQTDIGEGVYLFTLKKPDEAVDSEGVEEPEQELYAPDGRRIVRVAIPKGYIYQIEFHAKKYNQISDKTFVEIERFEDPMENYLGKGKRPDVIMFNEQTEIDEYIQKGVLENFLPLFEKQEKYSVEDIIPKARELLGTESEDGMYAMAGRFRLLGRTSDGTEYDSDGKCDAVSYLNWYDEFMKENEISGVGWLENLLYANVPAFYDVNKAETSFDSVQFQKLMQTYKDVYNRHKADIEQWRVGMEHNSKINGIARGPEWYASYSKFQLVYPDVELEGVPGTDGENHVYMRLDYPMRIMNTSDCKEAAFDFIMYYNSQAELLVVGDTEGSYGKSGSTYGIFSVYEENLRQDIYESEKPYVTMQGKEYFFTDEQDAQLRDLIDRAVSTTEAQRDIYSMLMEEIDAYLQDGKDLDSICEILENRVELYLAERM